MTTLLADHAQDVREDSAPVLGSRPVADKASLPQSGKTFRDQVQHQMMMERLVPPFRPPSTNSASGLFVILCIGGALGVLAALAMVYEHPLAGMAVGLMSVAAPVLGWFYRHQAEERRDEYAHLHKETWLLADRLLSGQTSRADSARKLEGMVQELNIRGAPQPGGWFVVVWWSEGDE